MRVHSYWILGGLLALTTASPGALRGEEPTAVEPVAGELAAVEQAATDPAALEFFEKKIRPLLVDNCYTCHSADTNAKGGLRVDDRNGLLVGGDSGAAIVPGKPAESLLLQAVKYSDDGPQMPPQQKLSDEQIADLTTWIEQGAVWPAVRVPVTIGKEDPRYETLRKEHWAWQSLKEVAPPAASKPEWIWDTLDAFVLAKLDAAGLQPVADADRTTLIRRVTFDLTGLPPTPEEIAAFVADSAPDAYARLVDRLLASPAFGERWGRHWLDVARFAESTGSSRNVPYPHAWRYRDYVVDAFNKDKPFDQFVREQVAGDLLPSESPEQAEEQQVATGLLALGVKDVNQRFKVRFDMDNIDEQIDTVSRSVLGLTASCARCHNHKFDPIPTQDYYALAGIFQSTDLCAGVRSKMGGGGLAYYDTDKLLTLGDAQPAEASGELAEKIKAAEQKVEEARKEFVKLRDNLEGAEPAPNGRPKRQVARRKWNRAQADLVALSDPIARGAKVALGVRDAQTIADTEIRIRGEAEKLGPLVPRGFLSVLSFADQPVINPAQSGRLELAQWLTHANNPLTPRVAVNRVWQHLFGAGLVSSVDNFGVTGDVPSHPELLDHLAARFVREGWSVKKLVRAIALSHAYQLGSESSPAQTAVDPTARLIWRHNPRRLTAEEIRDATLHASGRLDLNRPEASPARALPVQELRNNGPEARQLADQAASSLHRSVYLPLLRGLTPTALEVFDFAEQGMVTGHRETTTVAPQALYLLNDPFVRKQSLALAERVLSRADLEDGARVDLSYQLILGRAATESERVRALAYLAEIEQTVQLAQATAPVIEPVAEQATEQLVLPAEPVAAGAVAATEAAPVAVETTGANGEASVVVDTAATDATPKPAPQPVNPDEADQSDAPVVEEVVEAANARAAAWASFCQALLGSAEFRYVK